MRTARTFTVVSVDQNLGEVVLRWNNGVVMNHRIPVEYETGNWTELQLRAYLSNEAPDIPDMPQFLLDEDLTRVTRDNVRKPADI